MPLQVHNCLDPTLIQDHTCSRCG